MAEMDKYELVAELARRRGFFWPSFEIYGGVRGFIDYGPLGISLRRKIEQKWRSFFVDRYKIFEIDTPIIMPEKIFQTSGHVKHFKDPMVFCRECERAFRADHLLDEIRGVRVEGMDLSEIAKALIRSQARCSECGGHLSEPKQMSTMFRTSIGPLGDSVGYGRPELAQGMFIDFKRVCELSRDKFPIGIAQIGRGLRNEVSPRQGPIRLREFNMMEFEFFFDPQEPQCTALSEYKKEKLNLIPISRRQKGIEDPISVDVETALDENFIQNEWLAYFMLFSQRFVFELGIPMNCQRFYEKLPGERAHYSSQTYDHEVLLDRWGWVEVAGHAYRGDFDLKGHMKASSVDLRVFKQYSEPRMIEIRTIKPNIPLITKEFKDNAADVVRMLTQIKVDDFERMLQSHGYFDLGGFRLSSHHATVVSEVKKESGKRFLPHVVEPSFGTDRLLYAAIEYAYSVKDERVVLRMPSDLAPMNVVVLPLMRRNGLQEKAWDIYYMLHNEELDAGYDESGSIGRRYARADEAGIPLAVTIDYDTLRDSTVTLRDRDSWSQVRVEIDMLTCLVQDFLGGKKNFETLGQAIA